MNELDPRRHRQHAREAVLHARQAKAGARKSEEQADVPPAGAELRNLIHKAPVAMGLAHGRTIVEINDRLSHLTGYGRDELVGQDSRILYVSQDDYDRIGGICRGRIPEPDAEAFEARWRRKDGRTICVLLSGTFVRSDDQSREIIFTAIDVTARKQADAGLRESLGRERFLADIIRDAPVAIAIGFPDGRLGRCNAAFCALTGYTPEALKEQRWNTTLTPPEWQEFEAAMLAQISPANRVVCYEKECLRKDGSGVPVEVVVKGCWGPDGQLEHYTAFATEITERKRAAREIEDLGRFPAENPYPVFRVDRNGTILYANPASGLLLTEWATDIGRPAPGDWRATVTRALASDAIERLEIEHENRVFVFHAVPRQSADYVNFYAVDITELRRTKEELQNIFNLSLDMVCIADIRTNAFIKVNPAFTATLGYEAHELLGRPSTDFVHPEDVDRTKALAREVLNAGKAVINFDNRYRCKDGSYRWLSWTSRPNIEQGLTYAVARDVTESKRIHEGLAEGAEKYRRMEANIPGMVYEYVLHPDGTHSFPYVTAESKDLFDLEPEDVMRDGTLLSELIHPDDRIRRDQSIRISAETSQPWRQELRHIVNGQVRWYDCMSRPERQPDGGVRWDGIILETTDRKRAEEALRQSEQLLREAEQIAHVGSFSRNVRTDALTWSGETYRIFGFEPGEVALSYEFLLDHIHPGDRDRFAEASRLLASGGAPYDIEYRIVRKDGEQRTVRSRADIERDSSGRPLRLFGAIQDVTDQREAERALRMTQFALDHAPDPVQWIDSNSRLFYVNEAACRTLGYTRDELLRTTIPEIDPAFKEGDRDRCCSHGTDQPTPAFETHHKTKDGRIFPVEVSCRSLTFEGELFYCTFVRDITERKAAEAALRESETRFRELAELLPQAVFETDLDGRFLYANRLMSESFGYHADELSRLNMKEMFAPEGHEKARRDFEKKLAGTSFTDHEHIGLRKDGTRCPMRIYSAPIVRDGRAMGLRGIVIDSTEEKRAEEALRESTARLQSVFDSSPLAITVTDLDGNIVDCSQAALDMYGLTSKAEGFGRNFLEFIAEKDHCLAKANLTKLLQRGSIQDLEYTLVRRDGTEFPGELCVSLMRDPRGQPLGLVGISADITERMKAEAELLANQARLRSLASELSLAEERERRRIAADLHDHACQSLALSKMKLQALLETAHGADAKSLDSICEVLDRTIGSVRELTFDLSSPTLYKFGLAAALEELLSDRLKTEYGIIYRFSDDGQPKPLTDDVRVLLYQSVRELLINVIKHAQAEQVELDIARKNGSIRLIVADNGVGFDVQNVLSPSSRPRGFGLFNVKERLDHVGGRLEIDSRLGHGSRFVLTAPLAATADTAKGGQEDAREDSAR